MLSDQAAAASTEQGNRRREWLGGVVLLAVLWLVLVNQLRLDWETNPQYSYGWLVPFLAAYLAWLRWVDRPEASRVRQGVVLAGAAMALALLFFPTRLIREATPEWSVVSWALALEVVGLSLLGLGWMGGWRTLRHFAWPIGFFLVAVAWPVRFETSLTQTLMHELAGITTEISNLAGIPAVAEGNLIRLGSGVVGVDEACSGVRSLQSMLMASIFLGEAMRLPWLARGVLVAIGLLLALVFNVLRALLLVGIVVRQGLEALGRWHDPAGYSILVVSFVVLCAVAQGFRRSATAPAPDALPRSAGWRPIPWAWLLGFGAWFGLAEVATEAWYRLHERGLATKQEWRVVWPEDRPEFHELEVKANVRKMLAYSAGREVSWHGAEGSQWLAYFFQWNASRTSTISARQHRPEVCLPAGGRTLREERPVTFIEVGDMRLPFRTYVFDEARGPLHVFFCLWEVANRDAGRDAEWRQDYSRESRLQRVKSGQRNLGQQSLEVIVSGIDSPEAAQAEFEREMRAILAAGR